MALDDKIALKIQLRTILQTIQERRADTGEQVTVSMAEHYNKIRGSVARVVPSVDSYLPPEINLTGDFVPMGLTDATKFDLQTYTNQIIALLEAI